MIAKQISLLRHNVRFNEMPLEDIPENVLSRFQEIPIKENTRRYFYLGAMDSKKNIVAIGKVELREQDDFTGLCGFSIRWIIPFPSKFITDREICKAINQKAVAYINILNAY